MKRILKFICLLPLLLCINCGLSDSVNDIGSTLTFFQDEVAGAAGEGGIGAVGFGGNSDCDLDTHKCN